MVPGKDVGDQIEDGGLAGAVGADHGGHLMRRDVESDVIDRLQAPETLGEVAHAQHGVGTHRCIWLGVRYSRHSALAEVSDALSLVSRGDLTSRIAN